MPTTPDQFANFTPTTVAGGAGGIGTSLNSTDTVVYLPAGFLAAHYPGSYPFMLLLGSPTAESAGELIQATGTPGTDQLTIVRGNNLNAPDTCIAQTWPVGTALQACVSAGGMQHLWQEIQYGWYNVKAPEYGALGNNVHDDTTAVQAAINAANTAGGGTVYFPAGIYICQTLTMYSYVHLRGEGMLVSEIRLKGSTNADLIWGGATNQSFINVTNTSIGTGNAGGLAEFGFHDLAFNGTKGTQSGTSYVIDIYGYGMQIENCSFKNGLTGGVLLDWNGGSASPVGSDSMIAHIKDCSIHENNGTGLLFGGPHDSFITNVEIFLSGTNDCYISPHSGTTHLSDCHFWSPEQSGASTGVACLVETTTIIDSCQFEGSDLYQLVLLCSGSTVMGGAIFSSSVINGSGILLGQQAGDTPIPGSAYQSGGVATAVVANNNMIMSYIHDCPNSNGMLHIRGDTGNGGNIIRCSMSSNTNGIAVLGNINPASIVEWTSVGLTAGQGNANFQSTAGDFAMRQSTSAPATATNGTIAVATLGVSRVSPTGNITGVILGVGVFAGQQIQVVNESSFTIQFAISGTSHVADGTSDTIAALTARAFVWDSGTSLWYRMG